MVSASAIHKSRVCAEAWRTSRRYGYDTISAAVPLGEVMVEYAETLAVDRKDIQGFNERQAVPKGAMQIVSERAPALGRDGADGPQFMRRQRAGASTSSTFGHQQFPHRRSLVYSRCHQCRLHLSAAAGFVFEVSAAHDCIPLKLGTRKNPTTHSAFFVHRGVVILGDSIMRITLPCIKIMAHGVRAPRKLTLMKFHPFQLTLAKCADDQCPVG